MQNAIEINNLSLSIDKKQILTDINAHIVSGTIVGLLGPSGAGKTTLIRAILGLQKPTNGTITVHGLKAGSKSLKSSTGYVTQALSIYADLTVLENVSYFASLLKTGKNDVQAVIKKVELEKYQRRLVGSLSGGEKARVSLAAALLGSPKLLLLDEPTVGLDPLLRRNLWRTFKDLARAGTTILITSHVMDEANKCDALMFIRDGRLLISDTKDNVMKKTSASSMEDAFLKLAVGDSHES
jgi:ABC-2 type transport system ATP-binding protein